MNYIHKSSSATRMYVVIATGVGTGKSMPLCVFIQML